MFSYEVVMHSSWFCVWWDAYAAYSIYESYMWFYHTPKGTDFPDEYHRLNKRTLLLIESRPAVTCGTKQTHPESREQAVPTSQLFVLRSHPQQTTPMWSPCFTPSLHDKNAHDSQNNMTLSWWKLWNNHHHKVWSHMLLHPDMKQPSFTSAKLTTAPSGTFFWNFFLPNWAKEACCYHLAHILCITLHNGMQGGMLISHARQAGRKKNMQSAKLCQEHSLTGAKRSRAPKSTTPPSHRRPGFNSRTSISTGNRRGWFSANSPTLLEGLQVCVISFGKHSEMALEIMVLTDTCAEFRLLAKEQEFPFKKSLFNVTAWMPCM